MRKHIKMQMNAKIWCSIAIRTGGDFMIDIPCIETERLILRALLQSNLPAINYYLSQKRMSFVGSPFDEVGTLRALLGSPSLRHLHGFGFWHIEHHESAKIAGAVDFLHHFDRPETEIGWSAHHDFKGKGMAYEAALADRYYGETHLNLCGVLSFNDPADARSAALAIRLGVEFEKTYCLRDQDCHVYRYPVSEPPKKVTQPEMEQ